MADYEVQALREEVRRLQGQVQNLENKVAQANSNASSVPNIAHAIRDIIQVLIQTEALPDIDKQQLHSHNGYF